MTNSPTTVYQYRQILYLLVVVRIKPGMPNFPITLYSTIFGFFRRRPNGGWDTFGCRFGGYDSGF